MKKLHRNALASLPMTEPEVDVMYSVRHSDLPAKRLCESHERLRMELQGCEALLEEETRRIQTLRARQWECPDCGFKMDCGHAQSPTTEPLASDCPSCNKDDLQEELRIWRDAGKKMTRETK